MNIIIRSSRPEVLCRKLPLEISQNSQENTCARVSFLIKLLQLITKETLARVFSYEFCKISKNTFFYRTPPVAASGQSLNWLFKSIIRGVFSKHLRQSALRFVTIFICFQSLTIFFSHSLSSPSQIFAVAPGTPLVISTHSEVVTQLAFTDSKLE